MFDRSHPEYCECDWCLDNTPICNLCGDRLGFYEISMDRDEHGMCRAYEDWMTNQSSRLTVDIYDAL